MGALASNSTTWLLSSFENRLHCAPSSAATMPLRTVGISAALLQPAVAEPLGGTQQQLAVLCMPASFSMAR
jgi:hypothetical protein